MKSIKLPHSLGALQVHKKIDTITCVMCTTHAFHRQVTQRCTVFHDPQACKEVSKFAAIIWKSLRRYQYCRIHADVNAKHNIITEFFNCRKFMNNWRAMRLWHGNKLPGHTGTGQEHLLNSAVLLQHRPIFAKFLTPNIPNLTHEDEREREIKFIGLFENRGHRGPYSPYKPFNHNLYIGIIIFPHIDNPQYTGYDLPKKKPNKIINAKKVRAPLIWQIIGEKDSGSVYMWI